MSDILDSIRRIVVPIHKEGYVFILIAAYIIGIVFAIIAAVKAGQGEWWTYPLTINFVK